MALKEIVVTVVHEDGQKAEIHIPSPKPESFHMHQVSPCAIAYGTNLRPNELCPTGERGFELRAQWTDPEAAKRFQEFIAKHGAANVEYPEPLTA